MLPKLISQATGRDLNTRHGSIVAVGQVCLALSQLVTDDRLLEGLIPTGIREEITFIQKLVRMQM